MMPPLKTGATLPPPAEILSAALGVLSRRNATTIRMSRRRNGRERRTQGLAISGDAARNEDQAGWNGLLLGFGTDVPKSRAVEPERRSPSCSLRSSQWTWQRASSQLPTAPVARFMRFNAHSVFAKCR